MAKKVETVVTMTDDLDGSKAERTVTFGYDGATYEIDLSKRNASALEKVLAPYIAAGRKVSVRARRNGRAVRGAPSARRSDITAVRNWARENGYEVSDRGRIPTTIIEAYESAH